jgi:general secretion pathway protein E
MSVTGRAASTDAADMASLAHVLHARSACDQPSLDRAGRLARQSGQRLDHVLLQLGLVAERALADAYGAALGLAVLTADRFPDQPVLPDTLRPRFLRDARLVPVALTEGRLRIAMADPFDRFAQAATQAATGLPVDVAVALPLDLEAALDRLYPADAAAPGVTEAEAPVEDDTERLKDMASEAPVIRLVNLIIGRAVETRASDIHIEPFEARLRVRYRYDGMLHEAEEPPAALAAAIISRIKIMARLDIAERRLPQDGRIKLAVRGQEVDFRVATIPSLHGETVVLRVLDRNAVSFDYARLGLAPAVVARLAERLDLPNGIVLVTGPTGSGKTTTLYAALSAMNAMSRKIVTVEDPIEYQLAGINQIQVKPQIGLGFASLLRAILRQDPDVIMVGEMRDLETAQIAVQAALTGHLVLSTVHTNSAAATVTRLRDMGLEDYLLTAVLRGILAQRLVRRLCLECRRPEPAPAPLVTRFGLEARTVERPVMLWHPQGCPSCRQTGYHGRLAITEFLVPDAAVEALIFARAGQAEIERAAVAAGMVTMFDAGLDAALAGDTTIEEVVRAIRAEA